MQNNIYKQAAPAVLPLKKSWQGVCPFVQGDLVESRSVSSSQQSDICSPLLAIATCQVPALVEESVLFGRIMEKAERDLRSAGNHGKELSKEDGDLWPFPAEEANARTALLSDSHFMK